MQHMTVHIMLYEATGMDYNPLDNRLILLVLANCGGVWLFAHHLNVYRYVIGLTAFVILCSFHFIINLTIELKNVLNIQVFTVK